MTSTVLGAFTPGNAALGGLLLGVSTVAQLLLTGRVLGISGTLKGTLLGSPGLWRPSILFGLTAASVPLGLFLPSAFVTLPESYSFLRAVAGGLLVGMGTGLGNGCTSGHGICGLARLSKRSLVFTMAFMAAGAAAATLAGSAAAAGIATHAAPALQLPGAGTVALALGLAAAASGVFAGIGVLGRSRSPRARRTLDAAASTLIGATFAAGLAISGMTLPAKVLTFLSPGLPAWDASLAFVMATALAVATPAYQTVLARLHTPTAPLRPRVTDAFSLPSSSAVDVQLLAGGLLFGAGWGLSGMCPGPAIVAFGGSVGLRIRGLLQGLPLLGPCLCARTGTYLAAMLVGMFAESRLSKARATAAGAKKGA